MRRSPRRPTACTAGFRFRDRSWLLVVVCAGPVCWQVPGLRDRKVACKRNGDLRPPEPLLAYRRTWVGAVGRWVWIDWYSFQPASTT